MIPFDLILAIALVAGVTILMLGIFQASWGAEERRMRERRTKDDLRWR
jgi:hypothetical protein